MKSEIAPYSNKVVTIIVIKKGQVYFSFKNRSELNTYKGRKGDHATKQVSLCKEAKAQP